MPSKTVLITGCSTGIGRDLAQRLAGAGYTVIASARHPETLADLAVALKLPLDVSDATSVAGAVEEVVHRFGRVDVLVNNAGYAARGAIEELSDEQVQRMFEVNVFGVMRMIRAVVPHMRRQGAGRIINISSIAGKLALPANGTYAATKFAVEALSDALRLELAPFGIQVVVIEPGAIRTHFATTVQAYSGDIFANPGSPYAALYQHDRQFETTMRGQEAGPQIVSGVVQRAIEAQRPRTRYLAAVPFAAQLTLHLGDSARDYVFKRAFKIAPVTPKRPGRDTAQPDKASLKPASKNR